MTISLEKRVEKVSVILEKFGVPAHVLAQVKLSLDVSKSTDHLYRDGHMQEMSERAAAVGFRLDADKKIGFLSFGTKAHYHGEIEATQVGGYINREFIPEAKRAGTWMSGTNYAALISALTSVKEKVTSFFGNIFGKKKIYPNMEWILSDGEDMGDSERFKKLISGAKDRYFVLIGVGPERYFGLMKEVADLYDNVGFAHFPDMNVSDDAMYSEILKKEALDWLIAHQPA